MACDTCPQVKAIFRLLMSATSQSQGIEQAACAISVRNGAERSERPKKPELLRFICRRGSHDLDRDPSRLCWTISDFTLWNDKARTSDSLPAIQLKIHPNLACDEFYIDHSERYLLDRPDDIHHLTTSVDFPEYKTYQSDCIFSISLQAPLHF